MRFWLFGFLLLAHYSCFETWVSSGPHHNSSYGIYAILIPPSINSIKVALTGLCFQASLVAAINIGRKEREIIWHNHCIYQPWCAFLHKLNEEFLIARYGNKIAISGHFATKSVITHFLSEKNVAHTTHTSFKLLFACKSASS